MCLICERQTTTLGFGVLAGGNWDFFSAPPSVCEKNLLSFRCFPLLKMEIVIDYINSTGIPPLIEVFTAELSEEFEGAAQPCLGQGKWD